MGKYASDGLLPSHAMNIPTPTATGITEVDVYALGNYNFGMKEEMLDQDGMNDDRFERLKEEYAATGTRRTVQAVIVVEEHGLPHFLLLQQNPNFFKLPGGQLLPHEDEIAGLKRILTQTLSVPGNIKHDWEIEPTAVATWWRPTFSNNMFPYMPAHVKHAKERRQIFLVRLPQGGQQFAIPRNFKLVAAPIFEVHNNPDGYGPIISSLPTQLSRFSFTIRSK
ncbi:Oidioi.mRNA.OKI2018_I69.XSR.g14918.t1.cds [Oikopleura dioica]|uniref:Cleavage and polyadenylation specificity factor subunit 5 n=1 Tax=Oikopleura dioica TaxID=34765 RepID=A0ABN7SF86_OIKDI|nr:Oidioi.mRNA.OKI2018_I69.XSR.g14918.t1.cds [Oikopleura dioica]